VRRAVVARATGEDATRRRAIDASDANAVARAAAALRRGGVIAVPTDTIYGFAASAANGDAVRRLYEIKGRRAGVPLAIAVGDVRDVGTYGDDGHLREGALARLLPGPTTVLLRRRRGDAGRATPELNPGVDLIGIRVPAHDFVREVCRAHGGAIALTSANRSGETSATAAEEFAELWDACDEVFDGGAIPAKRLGSTIVDLSSRANDFAIVRAGERCDELVRVLEGEFAMTRRDA
jgi:tRNA threonylcarbamoyl adenosine modification protein (Sua5/YciO/YrdC/YwlC family)